MGDVVRLTLTPEQASQLSTLVLTAARNHQNVIFLAVTVPSWLPEEGSTVWEMEVVSLPATLGQKFKKLISESN